jgi:tRNA-dihydrouridine synthase A
MMNWTDRHCRYFHRQLSSRALLYSEMVVADAAIHGPRDKLLGFDESQHPISLQLGGSDPMKLAKAAKIGVEFGYDEINLNVGCPSDRVQSGAFGACLMYQPHLVAECVGAIKAVVNIPVTVKSRIGVDDQDIETSLDNLADAVFEQGSDGLWVHARKAWLKGLNPKENRDIPPLDYSRVYKLKTRFPDKFIGINGGITSISQTKDHLTYVDGVMMGRVAYHEPLILTKIDRAIYGVDKEVSIPQLIEKMMEYASQHIKSGGKLSHITRHMLGMFHGQAGAKRFRQILSQEGSKWDASPHVLQQAFEAIEEK